MNNIDQISQTIGAFSSDIKHIREKVDEISVDSKSYANRITNIENELKHQSDRLDQIEPQVSKHSRVFDIGIGIFIAASSIFGALGSMLYNVAARFFY